ncbi:MAG: tRNA pseudouridine(55) synthase TruB [Clostridia bacterium]|nr:tRNA pseudouridine(55) synthase TruB [Clostridia bacterium]
MDGFLNVYKEKGATSHDIVNKIRKIFNTKKVGHTGTLDPNATGVLVVAVGKATKLIEYLENAIKTYEAELTLGITTDTEDIWGNVLTNNKVDVTDEQIVTAIKSFIGNIKQVPPMYSALKINGKKLYELAREGKVIDRQPRDITIYDIYDIKINDEKVSFIVKCSKGTYIRTLCKDIGEKLLVGATMSELKRIEAGSFTIDSAKKVDDITESDLIPINEMIKFMPKIELNENEESKYINGIKIEKDFTDGEYAVFIKDEFYGIGVIKDKLLKGHKKIL